MSSERPNEGHLPDSASNNSYDSLPRLGQVPSIAHSDTPSSSLSFGNFSTGLSVRGPFPDVQFLSFPRIMPLELISRNFRSTMMMIETPTQLSLMSIGRE